MSDIPHYQMYIDGEWVDGDSIHEIHSPATGERAATVAFGTVEHAERAVAAAEKAHRSGVWRNRTPAERAGVLEAMADHLEGRLDQLAALVAAENGACVRVGTAFHVGLAIASLRYSAAQCRTFEWERPLEPATAPLPAQGYVRHEPLGVVAA